MAGRFKGISAVLLLLVLGITEGFLSVEGEVNAAKYYDALINSRAGKAMGNEAILADLKEQEDKFYRLANDPTQYDPRKQIEAIRGFTRRAGPLLGLEDGHGPLDEMLRATRAVLGMDALPEGQVQHPWSEAKVITPLCAEFLTRVIKAHKRRATKNARVTKEEL
eukprot:scaffold274519_cov27-Tisochrysis_lutea.AAC.1